MPRSGSGSGWYYRSAYNARAPGYRPQYEFVVQPRPSPAPPQRPLVNTPCDLEEEKNKLQRLCRPTQASYCKSAPPRVTLHFENRTINGYDRLLWDKLHVYRDVTRMLWSKHGTLKAGVQK